jgi:HPt (histidine-containing phosphotransfer) domain-containing protein
MDCSTYQEIIKQHLKTAYLLSDEKTACMIPVFVKTLRSHMDRLMELATIGDRQQLSRASHAVKGALLNLGLTDLAETAYIIEKQCTVEDNTLDYQTMIAELQSTVSLFAEDQ